MAKKKSSAKGADSPKRKKPLPAVEVEGFGRLVHCRPGCFWAGVCSLPALAETFGREVFGTAAERSRLGWNRMPSGSFPVEVKDERNAGPSPEQAAALRLLASDGAKISRAVLRCHAAAQKAAFKRQADDFARIGLRFRPELYRPKCAGVRVLDLYWQGVAYVAFLFLGDGIDEEHGSEVAYHPRAGAHWTSNPYETVTDADPTVPEHEPERTPGDRLAEAVIGGDARKVERLLARGADINDLSKGEWPPLYYAVTNAKVELVRQLLALGADPNKRGGEKRSVLSEAKESVRDLRATLKLDFLSGMTSLRNLLTRSEEIVDLLVAARAR